MELKKFRLEKKWWTRAGKYTIMESKGNKIFYSNTLSAFKTGIRLLDASKSLLLTVRSSSSWNTSFSIWQDDMEIAYLKKKSVWSSKEYLLSTSSYNISITSKNWGKQMNFVKAGQDIAHASAKGSMWKDIGVVMNEDEDSGLILVCVILICYLKANGYA